MGHGYESEKGSESGVNEIPGKAYPAIRHFVQETLGCTCPHEVLNNIDCQQEGDDLCREKITVGDRLLIYIISMERKSSIQDVVLTALKRGIEEREARRLNRFRLVLVTSRPEELRCAAEGAFESSCSRDKQTHLHIVHQKDVAGFLYINQRT
jgi:hypothetical protein